jgi:hypothetical protein
MAAAGIARAMLCRRLYRTAVIAACLGIVIAVPALGQRSKSEPYRIASVKAYLYLNHKDSLSANIIDNPDMGELLNVTMGPDWLGSPSEEVLITVEIAGKPGDYVSGRRIRLTVTKLDGTLLIDRQPRIGLLGERGKWFETFVVYDVGCDTLRIRAQVLGQGEPSVMERKIPFVCGE